jgi:hypothetical protein
MRTLTPALQDVIDSLEKLAVTDPHLLSDGDLVCQAEALVEVTDHVAGLLAHTLQVADARQAVVSERGRTTRSWLSEEMRLSREDASRRMTAARELPLRPILAQALRAGDVNLDHARVIRSCLRKIVVELRPAAEAELVQAALFVSPDALAALCREVILRYSADDDAEAAAQRKYDDRWCTAATTFQGMLRLEAMLDPESAATVMTAINALMGSHGPEDERTVGQRRADALVELAGFSLDHGDLPDVGGHRPHLVATLPFDELRHGLGAGQLGHGTLNGRPLTPGAARRLACDAGVIPAVLGGASELLDLGRTTPTWSTAQRRAAALRDGGCGWPECTAELSRCQLHHIKHWLAHHGFTDLANSVYLCRFHHWLVHHTDWTIRRKADGTIAVHRT